MYILFICGDSKYILKAVLPPNFSFLLLKQLLFILLFNLRACEPLTDQKHDDYKKNLSTRANWKLYMFNSLFIYFKFHLKKFRLEIVNCTSRTWRHEMHYQSFLFLSTVLFEQNVPLKRNLAHVYIERRFVYLHYLNL